MNFIRNSPISSPYGYTVKLANDSKPLGSLINDDTIRNKTIPIAWFVSNCKTASKREIYVKYLKVYFFSQHLLLLLLLALIIAANYCHHQ